MPRTIPITPPKLKAPTLETWTLRLKTITPMFGGSATPREVDPENPVRAASVRGHLRFWWRATAGGQYTSAEKLFKEEEEIWGSAKKHGQVCLKVTHENPGTKKSYADFVSGFGDARGYALFPFAENRRKGISAASCLQDVVFSVVLSCPDSVKPEVERAVYAWVGLGGIGARTRRGCGSLEVLEENPQSEWYNASLATLAPVTCLVGKSSSNAVAAWREAVELYKEFRQGKDFARDPGSDPSKPLKLGRSRYPEADTIRTMFPDKNWRHKVRHAVQGFPRADLGLPIVFHFQEEGPKDDFILELAWEGHRRFASPVITKAVKVDGKYAPAIIVLNSPNVWDATDLVLKLGQEKKAIPRNLVELTPEERKKVSPLGGLPIREALVEFAKSRGYEEVHL